MTCIGFMFELRCNQSGYMLQTYALILLLNLTDDEQLLATNIHLSDPIGDTMELKLSETDFQDQISFENYEDNES